MIESFMSDSPNACWSRAQLRSTYMQPDAPTPARPMHGISIANSMTAYENQSRENCSSSDASSTAAAAMLFSSMNAWKQMIIAGMQNTRYIRF